MGALLSLAEVTVEFDGIRALDRLSLEVQEGRITGIIGPNGAGKTTAFHVLTGFIVPNTGRVHLAGTDITGLKPMQVTRRGVVRTFQELRLFPTLTVVEHVVMALPRHNIENPFRILLPGAYPRSARRRDTETARALLDYVGLGHIENGRLASQLSYGQQKLLALARALATESQVLLLDEPTSGLDPNALAHKMDVIRRLVRDGRTVCLVEHNMDVVARLCDTVVVLHQGARIAEGPPEQIMSDPFVLSIYLGGEAPVDGVDSHA